MTEGPIIIVEDDKDDQDIYAEVIRNLGIKNELRFFYNGQQALDYLNTTSEQPFIILSDINMPQMTGLQLKEHIQNDEYLRTKGIPFVFVTTNDTPASVKKAHKLSVQGYFKKPDNMKDIQSMLQTLFDYWALCRHINNV